MRFRTTLAWMMLAAVLVTVSGCGGGNDSTGVLTLAVTPSTTALKSAVTASATYANPNKSSVQGIKISFRTNHPELFYDAEGTADSAGKASVLLTPKPLSAATGPTGPVVVLITASVGDLVQTASFTVKPASLVITPPPEKSFSAGDITAGGILRYVPSGMFVKVVDGSGNPVPQGTSVTVSVDSIVNGTAGDVIFWKDFPGGTTSAPSNVFTKGTDATGQVPIQATIDVIVPSSATQAISVIWRVTTTDPDSGATIIGYATSMLSITP